MKLKKKLSFKMNSKFYISYEAARLLKEKGYNAKCNFAYADTSNGSDINGRIVFNSNDYPVGIYPCPTKAEAIDWLEGKGMCIVVIRRTIDNEVGWRYVIYNQTEIISGFSTRLQAEDAAIIKALELL